uniref:Uncharacterized protein n=1 Tax=Lutzomyia longipalpis TaxID=7200 RepID=A0A7G3B3F2_LUTLO
MFSGFHFFLQLESFSHTSLFLLLFSLPFSVSLSTLSYFGFPFVRKIYLVWHFFFSIIKLLQQHEIYFKKNSPACTFTDKMKHNKCFLFVLHDHLTNMTNSI